MSSYCYKRITRLPKRRNNISQTAPQKAIRVAAACAFCRFGDFDERGCGMWEACAVRRRSRLMQFPDRSNTLLGQERLGEFIGLRVRYRHSGMFFRR